MFFIWTQAVAQQKFLLSISLSPNSGLSDLLSES